MECKDLKGLQDSRFLKTWLFDEKGFDRGIDSHVTISATPLLLTLFIFLVSLLYVNLVPNVVITVISG